MLSSTIFPFQSVAFHLSGPDMKMLSMNDQRLAHESIGLFAVYESKHLKYTNIQNCRRILVAIQTQKV